MAEGTPRSRRRIGDLVQEHWQDGLTQEAVANAINVKRQTISRLLNGENLVQWPTVCAVLVELGAPKSAIQQAKALHEAAAVSLAGIEHSRDMPAKYRNFRLDEREAIEERTLDQSLFPGMLQPPEYAEVCAVAAQRRIKGKAWSEQAAAEREDRQSVLYRDKNPLFLHSLVDVSAIRKLVGGPAVMGPALAFLEAAAMRDNIVVQVIPDEVGAYGAHSSPIILLKFDHPREPRAAFVEGWTGIEQIDWKDEAAMDTLHDVWDDVQRLAMSPDDSLQLIREQKDRVSRT